MYLPAVPATALDMPSLRGTDGDEEPGGKEAVLVVEDDPFVRSHAIRSLESLGYRVTAAVDGNDALQKLGTDIAVDVLFTDIVMPGGLNGWELAERARQDRPKLRVLLTSGYALETLTTHERLRDCSTILTKPYRKFELARRLREVLMVNSAL